MYDGQANLMPGSFGARYYSSQIGRFLTPDFSPDSGHPEAIPFANLGNPQSLNLYSYVLNNPVSNSDPDGHLCLLGHNFLGGFGGSCSSKPSKLPVKEGDDDTALDQFLASAHAESDKLAHQAWSNFTGASCRTHVCQGSVLPEGELEQLGAEILGESSAADVGAVRVVEAGGGVVHYSIAGSEGEIEVMANVSRDGDTLVLQGTHIEGQGTGTSSVSELREAARAIGRQAGVAEVRIEVGIRASGANPGRMPSTITIKVNQ